MAKDASLVIKYFRDPARIMPKGLYFPNTSQSNVIANQLRLKCDPFAYILTDLWMLCKPKRRTKTGLLRKNANSISLHNCYWSINHPRLVEYQKLRTHLDGHYNNITKQHNQKKSSRTKKRRKWDLVVLSVPLRIRQLNIIWIYRLKSECSFQQITTQYEFKISKYQHLKNNWVMDIST